MELHLLALRRRHRAILVQYRVRDAELADVVQKARTVDAALLRVFWFR